MQGERRRARQSAVTLRSKSTSPTHVIHKSMFDHMQTKLESRSPDSGTRSAQVLACSLKTPLAIPEYSEAKRQIRQQTQRTSILNILVRDEA